MHHKYIIHSVKACMFGGLVVFLHSTHTLEVVLFGDALYWFAHHVWEAFEVPHKIRQRRRSQQ